jgi:hypothetical protein
MSGGLFSCTEPPFTYAVAPAESGYPRMRVSIRLYFCNSQNESSPRIPSGQSSSKHSFIYMKSFIKQLKKDEIVIGSAIVVFTFIVEFTRYVIHN